jgi:tetratricopeptide (TPR) repeat protein
MLAAKSEYERTVLAHAGYFADLLEAHGPLLLGCGKPDGGLAQLAALRLLKLEQENFFEALDTALNHRLTGPLLLITRELWHFLRIISDHHAISASYQRILMFAQRNGLNEIAMHAHCGLDSACFLLGNLNAALQHSRSLQALAVELDDRLYQGVAWRRIASAYLNMSELERARECLDLSHEIVTELGDTAGAVSTQRLYAHYYTAGGGDVAAILGHVEESCRIARERGDELGWAYCAGNKGLTLAGQGRFDETRQLYAESTAVFARLGERQSVALSDINSGWIEIDQGNLDVAEELLQRGYSLGHDLGVLGIELLALTLLGILEIYRGNYARARAILEDAAARSGAVPDPTAYGSALEGLIELAWRCDDQPAFRRWLACMAATVPKTVGEYAAIDMGGVLALLAAREGDYLIASQLLHSAETQALARGRHLWCNVRNMMDAAAQLIAEARLQADPEMAEALGAAERQGRALAIADLQQLVRRQCDELVGQPVPPSLA